MKNRGRTLTGEPPKVWFHWHMFFSGKMNLYEREVFMYLKVHCNSESWQCWPSYGTVAEEIGISRYQVIKSVKALEAKGIISVERRKNSKGEYSSNMYTINDNPYMWMEETAFNSDVHMSTSTVADMSDADILAAVAEAQKRGLLPEAEKTESPAEDPEQNNVIYMEKAPASSPDQSRDADTQTQKITASNEEETALFVSDNTTTPMVNASISDEKVGTIVAAIEAAAPGLLKNRDCRAAAKEIIKRNPGVGIDQICAMASELTRRTADGYHAGKVRKPIAYLITSIKREHPAQPTSTTAPMGGDLRHEHRSSSNLEAILKSLKDDGGGGEDG